MTIFEALHDATEVLKTAWAGRRFDGEHHPQLEAQIILSKLLGQGRAHLLAHATDDLSAADLETFRSLITRRAGFEPVAHLFGTADFYGHTFAVNKHTLIPRPDSELLIDEARKIPDGTMFWDIGTGSGALAVTIALERPRSMVIATDLSTEALTIAEQNADTHSVRNRLQFFEGDLLAPIFKNLGEWLAHTQPESVAIVANLPYIPLTEKPFLDPDVVSHEPHTALFGGNDGLDLYRRLFRQLYEHRHDAPRLINLIVEFDPSSEHALPELLKKEFPHATAEILFDIHGKARVLTAQFPLRSTR